MSFAIDLDQMIAIRLWILFMLILTVVLFKDAAGADLPKISYLTYFVSVILLSFSISNFSLIYIAFVLFFRFTVFYR